MRPNIFLDFLALSVISASLLQSPLTSVAEPSSITKSSPPESVNEIIVTASPNDRTVQESSESISVVPASALQNQGSEQLAQSLSLTPNINFAGGTTTPRFFQIRGIGELEQYEGAPNYSIGFFLDDIDLSGLGGVSTFDLHSLEVLRGPQATAYGANALGGIIHMSSGELTNSPDGNAKFSFGSDNLQNEGVAYGGTTEDGKTKYRLSVFHESQNGFRNDLFLHRNDTNSRETNQGIFKVAHDLTSESSITLTLLNINTDNGYDAFAIDNSFHTQSDRPGWDNQNILGSSIKYINELSKDWKLTTVTSFTGAKSNYAFDGDWGNNPFWGVNAPYDYSYESTRKRDTVWQDIRFTDNNKNYVLGETPRYLLAGYVNRFFEKSDASNLQNNIAYDILKSNYQSTTTALYGERETPLISGTSLTTGVRIERKEASYNDSRQTQASPTDSMIGGSVSLNQKLTNDTTSYILASRGYRAGGVNTGLNIPDDKRTFDSESLWNYELGFKSNFKEIKTTSNLSFFRQESNNAQVKGAYQLDPSDPLTFTYITDNAAKGFSQGVEWELSSKITDRFSLNSQVSLLQTELNANTPGLLQNRARSHSPAWSYSVAPTYFLTDRWFTSVQVTGMGSFYYDDSFDKRSSPYSLVNASIGYQTDRFTTTLWIKNIFDKEYAVRGFYFGVEPPDYPSKVYKQLGDPLSFGASVAVNF